MRSGTGVCAAESFRLVGDDRVASVDLNLMAKRATDWSRCGCHSHVPILSSGDRRGHPEQTAAKTGDLRIRSVRVALVSLQRRAGFPA